jgi:hypothetical protein
MRYLSVVLTLCATGAAWAVPPRDYSADLVMLDGGQVMQTMKLNVSGPKSRLDTVNGGPMGRVITIARKDRGLVWTVYPAQHQYSEKPLNDQNGAKPDLANFDLASMDKQYLGRETMLGYACAKLRVQFGNLPNNRRLTALVWVADALDLPIRLETMGVAQENRNIQVGPQPASLFEIPGGYSRTGAPGRPGMGSLTIPVPQVVLGGGPIPSVTVGAAGGAAWKDRVNYPGGDFRSIDMATSNPSACKAACDKDPRCKAWTLVKPESPGGMGYCWLKDSIPPAVAEDCCVSGVKGGQTADSRYAMEMNTNRYGDDYRDFIPSRPEPALCAEACAKDGSCRAWTWVKSELEGPNGHCWLKRPAPAKSPDDCCVSGVIR